MKKLISCAIVLVCAVSLVGCPNHSKESSSQAPKERGAEKGTKGGEPVLEVATNHDSYTVTQGSSTDVKITITRKPSSWDEPVVITFDNLPKGVAAPAETRMAKDQTSATYAFTATSDAGLVTNHGALVKATSGDVTASHPISITVKTR